MPMKKQENRNYPEQYHKNNHRHILLWVLILLLLILLSSCGLIYHLGKQAREQAEPNRQTIKVEPEEENKTILSLYGVVRYTNGTPCSDHTVELHSTPKTTVTGKDGSFFFYDVEHGEHQIAVLDASGNEKASMKFQIAEHEDPSLQYVKMTELNQQIQFEIPINTILLDVNLELDEQEQILKMEADQTTAALTQGRVLTSSASVQVKEGEAAVFASGHYMLQDGTIALANGGILLPEQIYLPPGAKLASLPSLPDGVTLDPDGNVVLEDQTKLDRSNQQITLPNGIVLRPDQTASMADDSILNIPDYGNNAYLIRETDSDLIGNGDAGSKNIGVMDETRMRGNSGMEAAANQGQTGDPERSEGSEAGSGATGNSGSAGNSNGSANSGSTGTSGASGSSGGSGNAGGSENSGGSGNSGNSGGSDDSGNSGGSGDSGNPTPPKPTGETGSVEIGDVKTGKLWKQMATIDLFTDPSGNQVYETLYPGIEGRYDFYICNTMKTITYMTVSVEEEANSKNGGTLPLEYKILDETGKEISGEWKNAAQLKAFSVTLQPNQNVNYSIRWRWPYERNDSAGSSQTSDAYDTSLATSVERSHKLKLVIHVEQ